MSSTQCCRVRVNHKPCPSAHILYVSVSELTKPRTKPIAQHTSLQHTKANQPRSAASTRLLREASTRGFFVELLRTASTLRRVSSMVSSYSCSAAKRPPSYQSRHPPRRRHHPRGRHPRGRHPREHLAVYLRRGGSTPLRLS